MRSRDSEIGEDRLAADVRGKMRELSERARFVGCVGLRAFRGEVGVQCMKSWEFFDEILERNVYQINQQILRFFKGPTNPLPPPPLNIWFYCYFNFSTFRGVNFYCGFSILFSKHVL